MNARSGPPYDTFIWFVVASGSIAAIAHIIRCSQTS